MWLIGGTVWISYYGNPRGWGTSWRVFLVYPAEQLALELLCEFSSLLFLPWLLFFVFYFCNFILLVLIKIFFWF